MSVICFTRLLCLQKLNFGWFSPDVFLYKKKSVNRCGRVFFLFLRSRRVFLGF
jgi:hypothetical protein